MGLCSPSSARSVNMGALASRAGYQTVMSPADSLLSTDDVLPALGCWRREGQRVCLVTIVGIEGAGPRPIGAQMAVAEDGRYAGYLSGGCLEQAVALEAQAAIKAGGNRLVRYGKGSPYFDVKLPCGSGLDLYFDQEITQDLLDRLGRVRTDRLPVALRTDLETGVSTLDALPLEVSSPSPRFDFTSGRVGGSFIRPVLPSIRLLLIGSGPAVGAIARVGALTGLGVEVLSPDAATLAELRAVGLAAQGLTTPGLGDVQLPDAFTALVLAFHEHDWEPPILAEALRSPAFYIGALGNRAVHAARLATLQSQGVKDADISRVNGPIGVITGAKSRATLGLGVVTEIAARAKQLGLVW